MPKQDFKMTVFQDQTAIFYSKNCNNLPEFKLLVTRKCFTHDSLTFVVILLTFCSMLRRYLCQAEWLCMETGQMEAITGLRWWKRNYCLGVRSGRFARLKPWWRRQLIMLKKPCHLHWLLSSSRLCHQDNYPSFACWKDTTFSGNIFLSRFTS